MKLQNPLKVQRIAAVSQPPRERSGNNRNDNDGVATGSTDKKRQTTSRPPRGNNSKGEEGNWTESVGGYKRPRVDGRYIAAEGSDNALKDARKGNLDALDMDANLPRFTLS